MPKIRPRKFGHPPKKGRCIAVARTVNAEHRELGLNASVATHEPSVRLSDVDEPWDFKSVITMTEAQARKLFREKGILAQGTKDMKCWECGSQLYPASSASSAQSTKDTLKCPECRTPGRHFRELAHASLAWSPWWKARTAGYEPCYRMFLRCCYCIGYRRHCLGRSCFFAVGLWMSLVFTW